MIPRINYESKLILMERHQRNMCSGEEKHSSNRYFYAFYSLINHFSIDQEKDPKMCVYTEMSCV